MKNLCAGFRATNHGRVRNEPRKPVTENTVSRDLAGSGRGEQQKGRGPTITRNSLGASLVGCFDSPREMICLVLGFAVSDFVRDQLRNVRSVVGIWPPHSPDTDSDSIKEAPHAELCITWGWTFIKRSATA
jgi:hypothetical protein